MPSAQTSDSPSVLFARRSIRLPHYDYREPGAYFVTICTAGKANLFGSVLNGAMTLNEIGRVVEDEWLKAVQARPFIKLDEYIVMPNHFHAILYIERPLERAKRHPHRLFLDAGAQALAGRCRGPFAESVGSTVAAFKSAVTKKVNTVRGMKGFPVWQRGYFERVVRDEDELNDIRTYIIQNPVRWDRDAENPLRASLRLTGKVFTLE